MRLEYQFCHSHQMFDLVHIKLDMRVHLQVLVVGGMDLVLDILLEVGHLIFND